MRCANEYPHVTLYLGKDAKAVESNEVCEWAFNDNKGVYNARKYETAVYNPVNAPAKFKTIYVTGRELILPGVYKKA